MVTKYAIFYNGGSLVYDVSWCLWTCMRCFGAYEVLGLLLCRHYWEWTSYECCKQQLCNLKAMFLTIQSERNWDKDFGGANWPMSRKRKTHDSCIMVKIWKLDADT